MTGILKTIRERNLRVNCSMRAFHQKVGSQTGIKGTTRPIIEWCFPDVKSYVHSRKRLNGGLKIKRGVSKAPDNLRQLQHGRPFRRQDEIWLMHGLALGRRRGSNRPARSWLPV